MDPIEIVCVSFHAPPHNSAESLCTIRLLSALAQFGIKIHLVTTEHPATLDSTLVRELTDPGIKITRVKLPEWIGINRAYGFFKYFFHSYRIEWARKAISETRRILSQYPNPPILISRSTPIVSNIVGFHCRDLAKVWIPHLSDPFPPYEWKEHWYSILARPLNFRWARRFATTSSLLTVTCKNAARFLTEKLKSEFGEKMFVLPHLAYPSINPDETQMPYHNNEFVLGHFGNLMERRNPKVLFEGIEKAALHNKRIRFLQYGHVDEAIAKIYEGKKIKSIMSIKGIENLSPRSSASLQSKVHVNVIIDTDLGLNYSPFLLSKFPHSVCSGQPLLMLTHPDSAMKDYTRTYGGGICASYRDSDSVAEAICHLYESHKNSDSKYLPSNEYKEAFSADKIIQPFLDRIETL